MTKSYGGLTRRSLPVLALICAIAVLGLGSSVASANSIRIPVAPTIVGDGFGDWVWTYEAELSGTGSEILSGDGFTIYNFGGFVGTLFTPNADWVGTHTSGTSGDGTNFGPFGFPPLVGTSNITFTYVGAGLDTTISDPLALGGFGATSTFSGGILGDYGADDHGIDPEGGLDLVAQTNAGRTLVPTPEPGTLALLGIGLLGLAVARKRRGI